jgi:2-polyprenyl-3-methyl-5-hydroxy-6-metoxy-1,4-benzoquinol methylase
MNEQPGFVGREACPVCTSRAHTLVYERSYDEPDFRAYMFASYGASLEYATFEHRAYVLLQCSKCRFVFQRDVLDRAGLQRLYDHWINPIDALGWEEESLTRNFLVFSQRIRYLAHLTKKSRPRVLDWGAGFGQFASLARLYGMDCYVLEISRNRQAHLQGKGIATLNEDEVSKTSFDIVNLDQILEHVSDPMQTLQHAVNALAPGGLLFISVPDTKGLVRWLSTSRKASPQEYKTGMLDATPVQHVNCFTHSTLSLICREAGLQHVFRPILYIRGSNVGVSALETAKNVLRPFHNRLGTTFFLRRRN